MRNEFIVMPRIEQDEEAEYIIVLPTHRKLAIQARQSRKRQAMYNKESYEYQTKVMLQRAVKLGWKHEDITMLIENKRKDGKLVDASGTLRIDQRPTMQDLWGYVGSGEYGAVMTRAVDRLFRHINMIEPAQFAEHCKQHGVIILTEHQRFDFNQRPEDTERFLQEAQKGANYLRDQIAMMSRYRREKALRGEYDGRNIPVGFVLDEDRLYYVVYEPHARVVRWIFVRFRELAGNFPALHREIAALPYLFPNAPGIRLPRMTPVENGYTITPRGLRDLLCNTAYIGWWLVYDRVYKTVDLEDEATEEKLTKRVLDKKTLQANIKHHHPAIVDELDFWYAYDHIKPDRAENEKMTRERFNKKDTIPCDAVLEGIITSDNGYRVYVHQDADAPQRALYSIVNPNEYVEESRLGAIYVKTVDRIFTEHLLDKLEEGKRLRAIVKGTELEGELDYLEDNLVTHFIEAAKTAQESTVEFEKKLKDYREEAASLENTLHYGAKKLPKEKVEEFSEDLAKAYVSIEQLELKKKRAQIAQAELQEFVEEMDNIPAAWKGMRISKKQRFIRLVTESITLTKPSPNWLLLDITWLFYDEWHNATRSLFYIWQRDGRGEAWTDEENSILRRLYSHADRATILSALPRRHWIAIICQARRKGLSRAYQVSNSGLPNILSVEDAAFIAQVGIELETPGQNVWYKEAIYTKESDSQRISNKW
jgi:hypothetical protein